MGNDDRYHIRVDFERGSYQWLNLSRDCAVEGVLIPYVNGQVVRVPVDQGKRQVLFNMKNTTFLEIYRTPSPIDVGPEIALTEDEVRSKFGGVQCTSEFLHEIMELQSGGRLTSLLQKALAPPKAQVFVIMRLGDKYLDSAYQGVMKKVAKGFGLSCLRIDEVQDSGKITDQILERIAESKFVLAELTGARPNCYYETGFAHALGKEMILTIRREEDAHFDLAGYRFIKWETEQELREALQARFDVLVSRKQDQTAPKD